jgi:hypothetical protein
VVLVGSKSPGSLSPEKRPGTSGRPASESFVEQFFSRPCSRQGSLLISSRQRPVYILVGISCLITAEVRKCLIPVRRTDSSILLLLIRRSEVPTRASGSHPVFSRLFFRMPVGGIVGGQLFGSGDASCPLSRHFPRSLGPIQSVLEEWKDTVRERTAAPRPPTASTGGRVGVAAGLGAQVDRAVSGIEVAIRGLQNDHRRPGLTAAAGLQRLRTQPRWTKECVPNAAA